MTSLRPCWAATLCFLHQLEKGTERVVHLSFYAFSFLRFFLASSSSASTHHHPPSNQFHFKSTLLVCTIIYYLHIPLIFNVYIYHFWLSTFPIVPWVYRIWRQSKVHCCLPFHVCLVQYRYCFKFTLRIVINVLVFIYFIVFTLKKMLGKNPFGC